MERWRLGDALEWLRTAVAGIEGHVPDTGFLNLILMTIETNLTTDPALEEARFAELRNRIGVVD